MFLAHAAKLTLSTLARAPAWPAGHVIRQRFTNKRPIHQHARARTRVHLLLSCLSQSKRKQLETLFELTSVKSHTCHWCLNLLIRRLSCRRHRKQAPCLGQNFPPAVSCMRQARHPWRTTPVSFRTVKHQVLTYRPSLFSLLHSLLSLPSSLFSLFSLFSFLLTCIGSLATPWHVSQLQEASDGHGGGVRKVELVFRFSGILFSAQILCVCSSRPGSFALHTFSRR